MHAHTHNNFYVTMQAWESKSYVFTQGQRKLPKFGGGQIYYQLDIFVWRTKLSSYGVIVKVGGAIIPLCSPPLLHVKFD